MKVLSLESILTVDVVACGTEERLGEMLRTMERKRSSCVVVVDEERRPCSIFTERDALALLAEGGITAASPVRGLMRRPGLALPLAVDFGDAPW